MFALCVLGAILIFLILVCVAVLREWFVFAFVGSAIVCLASGWIAWSCWKGDSPGWAYVTGVIALIAFVNMFKAFFRSRCPACGKFFKARRVAKNMIQAGDVFYEGSGNSRSAFQRNVYQLDYVCNNCQHEWSRTTTEKERVN